MRAHSGKSWPHFRRARRINSTPTTASSPTCTTSAIASQGDGPLRVIVLPASAGATSVLAAATTSAVGVTGGAELLIASAITSGMAAAVAIATAVGGR